MALPSEWRRLEVDGLDWLVEIWGDKNRVLCKGPHPATALFYSFEIPKNTAGETSWPMIDTIIGRRVNEYIKKYPDRWKKYWGEDGIFAQMGRNE